MFEGSYLMTQTETAVLETFSEIFFAYNVGKIPQSF